MYMILPSFSGAVFEWPLIAFVPFYPIAVGAKKLVVLRILPNHFMPLIIVNPFPFNDSIAMYVVDLQRPLVRKSAFDAFSAKELNYFISFFMASFDMIFIELFPIRCAPSSRLIPSVFLFFRCHINYYYRK